MAAGHQPAAVRQGHRQGWHHRCVRAGHRHRRVPERRPGLTAGAAGHRPAGGDHRLRAAAGRLGAGAADRLRCRRDGRSDQVRAAADPPADPATGAAGGVADRLSAGAEHDPAAGRGHRHRRSVVGTPAGGGLRGRAVDHLRAAVQSRVHLDVGVDEQSARTGPRDGRRFRGLRAVLRLRLRDQQPGQQRERGRIGRAVQRVGVDLDAARGPGDTAAVRGDRRVRARRAWRR